MKAVAVFPAVHEVKVIDIDPVLGYLHRGVEKLVENAAERGRYLVERLKKIRSRKIKEIRGRGLLVGIELKPEAGGARRYCEELMKEGLLCKETHEAVIRLAPPLIIRDKDINWALKRIKAVFKRLENC